MCLDKLMNSKVNQFPLKSHLVIYIKTPYLGLSYSHDEVNGPQKAIKGLLGESLERIKQHVCS